ncbi:MAG: hypothetical protein ACR2PK_16400 [Acidimicrobiales bacterium]
MSKYVLTYHGGAGMPETETEINDMMAAWGAWFGEMGEALVDGGNPFGQARSIAGDGSVSDDGQGLTGFSVIAARDIDSAVAIAKGCPILAGGGTVAVNEALDM